MAKIDAKVGHNNGYWSKINEFMCVIRFDITLTTFHSLKVVNCSIICTRFVFYNNRPRSLPRSAVAIRTGKNFSFIILNGKYYINIFNQIFQTLNFFTLIKNNEKFSQLVVLNFWAGSYMYLFFVDKAYQKTLKLETSREKISEYYFVNLHDIQS